VPLVRPETPWRSRIRERGNDLRRLMAAGMRLSNLGTDNKYGYANSRNDPEKGPCGESSPYSVAAPAGHHTINTHLQLYQSGPEKYVINTIGPPVCLRKWVLGTTGSSAVLFLKRARFFRSFATLKELLFFPEWQQSGETQQRQLFFSRSFPCERRTRRLPILQSHILAGGMK
jgi:hypothetical protein